MIKNKEHYQITGDINADYGVTVTNPIIKIAVSSEGVSSDGLLKCEYNIYISTAFYEAGKYFFKAEHQVNEGTEEEPVMVWKRLVNFTYPVADVPTWGIMSYKEEQRKIIADTFGLDLANVVLVEEV
jgi:hypothetical protein